MLWFLDWASSRASETAGQIELAAIARVWSAVDEQVLRTRAIEVLVLLESLREVPPAESLVTNIFRSVVSVTHENEPERSAFDMGLEIVDSLVTDRETRSLRVLGACLAAAPESFRRRYETHVEARVGDLGEGQARELMSVIRS